MELDPGTYRIEAWPPREKGGQHVGTGPSGVKITHESGLVACVDTDRSQRRNRAIAMEMIIGGLTCQQMRP